MKKPTMAIQLFTLRDHIQNAEDFDKTLERLQTMGVKDVQISSIGDIPAEVQKEILNKHGMKVCLTHKSYDWMKSDINAVIEHHKIIGCNDVGIGMAPPENRWNYENVERFISSINDLAVKFKEQGITLNYHNHAFEFYRLDDYKYNMMDMILNETDPDLLKIVFDVAWADYAGADPVEMMKKLKNRIKVLHFKDYTFDRDGHLKFVSLGKGAVDLRACYEAACELEIPYIAYEQDNHWVDGDAFKATEQSWDFMQSLI